MASQQATPMLGANSAPDPAMLAQPINDDDRFMALRDAAIHEDKAKAAQLHAAALGKYEIPSYGIIISYGLACAARRTLNFCSS